MMHRRMHGRDLIDLADEALGSASQGLPVGARIAGRRDLALRITAGGTGTEGDSHGVVLVGVEEIVA